MECTRRPRCHSPSCRISGLASPIRGLRLCRPPSTPLSPPCRDAFGNASKRHRTAPGPTTPYRTASRLSPRAISPSSNRASHTTPALLPQRLARRQESVPNCRHTSCRPQNGMGASRCRHAQTEPSHENGTYRHPRSLLRRGSPPHLPSPGNRGSAPRTRKTRFLLLKADGAAPKADALPLSTFPFKANALHLRTGGNGNLRFLAFSSK